MAKDASHGMYLSLQDKARVDQQETAFVAKCDGSLGAIEKNPMPAHQRGLVRVTSRLKESPGCSIFFSSLPARGIPWFQYV